MRTWLIVNNGLISNLVRNINSYPYLNGDEFSKFIFSVDSDDEIKLTFHLEFETMNIN